MGVFVLTLSLFYFREFLCEFVYVFDHVNLFYIMHFKKEIKCFNTLIFCLFFCSIIAQNIGLKDLEKFREIEINDSPEKAFDFLSKQLDFLSENISKNEAANLFEKYQDTIWRLTKNPEKRLKYSKTLVDLRLQSTPIDTLQLVKSYYFLASDADQINVYRAEALNNIEKAIKLWELKYTTPTNLYGEMLSLKGAILNNNGFIGESFTAFEIAAKIYTQIKDVNLMYLSSLHLNLAKNYTRYGFYKKALYYLNKVLVFYKNYPDLVTKSEKQTASWYGRQTDVFATYARLYKSWNKEQKLLDLIKEAEDFLVEKKLSSRAKYYMSSVYNYAGLYYLDTKNKPQKALNYFTKAYKIAPRDLLTVYIDYYALNMAKAKAKFGNKALALKELNVLDTKKQLPKTLKGFLYAARASIYADKDEIKKAIYDANSTLKVFSKSEINIDILNDSVVLNYQSTQRLNDTQQILNLANAFYKKSKSRDTCIIVANNLYKIAFNQFRNSYQKELYSKPLEAIFNSISLGIIKTNKLRFGNGIEKPLFFENFIKFKSDFLWHNFLKNRNIAALDLPDSLLKLKKQYRKKMVFYEKQQKLNINDSLVNSKLDEYEFKLNELSEHIQSNYTSFDYFENYEFNLDSFQSQLKKNEIVLNYKVLSGELFLFVITNTSINVKPIGNYNPIETKINKYLEELNSYDYNEKQLLKDGYELYNILKLNDFKNHTNWIIIPDKSLHYISFEALNNGKDYLIKNKSIRNSISLPFITFQYNINKSINRNPILFAPSYSNFDEETSKIALRDSAKQLQGTSEETNSIVSIIGGEIFNENEGTKDNFIKKAKDASILHLAMHAYLDENNNNLSNLAFSDVNTIDYKLYISELYGLNLNADLAVLSACNTGVGKEKDGEGIISLNRAFTYAGVPTTISSLWSVPDKSTKDIMINFYENLKLGLSSSEALRQSKLNYLKSTTNPKLQHPIYWAGFVHHGNSAMIKVDYWSIPWFMVLLGIIICLVVLYVFYALRLKNKS